MLNAVLVLAALNISNTTMIDDSGDDHMTDGDGGKSTGGGGTMIDWMVLLIGCIVLLPRLFAYAVTSSLCRVLSAACTRASLTLTAFHIGSLSLRQIGDLRVRLGRWRIAMPQPGATLYASIEVSVGSLCMQLCKRRPLTLSMDGAQLCIRLDEPNESEKRKEKELQSAAISPATANHGASSTARLHATPSSESWYAAPLRRLLLRLSDWIAISLSGLTIRVRKGDVEFGVWDVGLSMWVSDGPSSSTASRDMRRTIHVVLHGMEVRAEQVRTHQAFRLQNMEKEASSPYRMPPLFRMRRTEVTVDMQLQRSVHADCRQCADGRALGD